MRTEDDDPDRDRHLRFVVALQMGTKSSLSGHNRIDRRVAETRCHSRLSKSLHLPTISLSINQQDLRPMKPSHCFHRTNRMLLSW